MTHKCLNLIKMDLAEMREVICTEFVYFSEILNKTGSDFDLLPMPTSDQLEDEYKVEDFDPIKFCNESTMNTIIFYDVTQYMFQKFGNKIEKMTAALPQKLYALRFSRSNTQNEGEPHHFMTNQLQRS